MSSNESLCWGTRWTVPGWELPAPESDLGRWRNRDSGARAPEPAIGPVAGRVDTSGRAGASGPAADHEALASTATAEELERLTGLGMSALRVTLDWARLEPANGRLDAEAVEHLRAALALARGRGFAIWGCVHDGALPGWFAHDERGFADERARTYHWARHVETLGELVGDLVDGWIPVVEPTRWAKQAWLDGSRPPGKVDDGGGFARNLEGIQIASVEAARRLRESGRPVASAHWMVPVFPARDDLRLPPKPEAEVATDEVDEVLWRSWQRLIDEETLVLPGRSPVTVEGARQAFDVMGITYRHAVAVGADRSWHPYPQALATSVDGQVPWSEGLALSLHRVAEAWPDQDLVVVDVAAGLAEPEARARYLSEVRDAVLDVAGGGASVIGCFAPSPEPR